MNIEENMTSVMRRDFVKAYSDMDVLLKNCYCREEGTALLHKCRELKGHSGYVHRCRELIKNLNNAGIECSQNPELSELEEKVGKLPLSSQIECSLMDILYQIYCRFESPRKYIARVVRRFADPEFLSDSTRLVILKQFIKYTDYYTGSVNELVRERVAEEKGIKLHRGKKDTDSIIEYVDDSIFDVLDRQLSKYEKKKYTLLRLCDDIANGNFRTNGRTKNSLYIFAMAFNLQWYPDSKCEGYDEKKDFEKILFFDYYGNCVLRFISEDYNGRSADFEKEPTGEGINYKNFAEVIYLYYLSRTDLSPREKINRSLKMIESCVDKEINEDAASNRINDFVLDEVTGRVPYTFAYKDLYIDKVSKLSESELASFIVKNYSTGSLDSSASRIMVDSQTNTARFYYMKYIHGRSAAYGYTRQEKDAVNSFAGGYDEGFLELIKHMSGLLHMDLDMNVNRISRMRMIAAVYDYCLREGLYEGKGLYDIYCEFGKTMNRILIDSRFQPISEKNIFDMYAIISLYCESNVW